jgi:hypothetical protein
LRAAAAIAVAFLLVLSSSTSVRAVGTPYIPGESGYDISWPQCGDPPPATGTFAIIGINGGAPFTPNPCLNDQYAAAPRSAPPSLYLNTGYDESYRDFITRNCRQQASWVMGTGLEREAWAIGCSEGETSINYAYKMGTSSIAMWWLDVEVLNKWSHTTLSLNRYALQGAATRLSQTDLPVGIYSSEPMWIEITGVMQAPGNLSAEWNASGSCSTSFTRLAEVPVWLAQHTYNNLDHDSAC